MKHTLCTIMIFACLLTTCISYGQETEKKEPKKKKAMTIALGSRGLEIRTDTAQKTGKYKDGFPERHKKFESHWLIFDLGTNFMQDNTNYNSPSVQNFLDVPANRKNSNLFDLRQGKSINVNIYVWMETFNALKTKHQKINISTGIGLQLYNFRYENPITFTRDPNTVILDTIGFKKNKLAFDYLNVPLMFTFKTKLFMNCWLIYGVGITGGYRIASWTKQVSGLRGKVKVHDPFEFNDFNSCVTAELGLSGIFRLYGTYQLTNLYKDKTGMDQHPFSIGLRFSGI